MGSDRDRIPAHKLILAARSPVFDAMFYGPMAEQKEVVVPDIETKGFKKLLRYLKILFSVGLFHLLCYGAV